MTKVTLPLFRTKETEVWRGTKQVYGSMVKTQCLAVKSQALSYWALYLMTPDNPDHVEPLVDNTCQGVRSLSWIGTQKNTFEVKCNHNSRV